MSIATEISRLTTLRNNIRTKLINLGIISNSSATLSDCYTGLNGVTKQTASGNTTLNGSTTSKSFAAGYYPSAHGATHAVVNIPDPTITVDANGLITASGSWTAGFTSDTSYSRTSQLVPCPARVWVPTTTDQSISPPGFLTGVQTIKGDANLVAANIKSGVSIFGVSGTHSGGGEASPINSYINVTYPSGFTCTCSSGSTTLTTNNTSGMVSFSIPSAGSWTVSATDGSAVDSKTVTVAADNIYNVSLSVKTYILENGTLNSSYTINYGPYAAYYGTQLDSEGIHTVNQESAANTFYFTPANDVTDYSKLCARVNIGTAYGNYLYRIGLSPENVSFADAQSIATATSSSKWLSFVEQGNTNNNYITIETDISGIAGNACIASTGLANSLTTDIWFEDINSITGDPSSNIGIVVSYPVGSSCSCTNGTVTLQSKDTTGVCVFYVPSAGSWTVSCTNSFNTYSTVCNVLTGDRKKIRLSYKEYIMQNGTLSNSYSIIRPTNAETAVYTAGSGIALTLSSSCNSSFRVEPAIDFTNYSSFGVTISCTQYYNNDISYCPRLGLIGPNDTMGSSGYISVSERKNYMTYFAYSDLLDLQQSGQYVDLEVALTPGFNNNKIFFAADVVGHISDIWFRE